MKQITNVLLFIWQIVQNLVGILYLIISFAKYEKTIDNNWIYHTHSNQGSVSLGNFVFISTKSKDLDFTIKHELGHCKQSRYLGPFYLLIVGLPSIIWVLLRRMIPMLRKRYSYYSVFPENWANKLMKI